MTEFSDKGPGKMRGLNEEPDHAESDPMQDMHDVDPRLSYSKENPRPVSKLDASNETGWTRPSSALDVMARDAYAESMTQPKAGSENPMPAIQGNPSTETGWKRPGGETSPASYQASFDAKKGTF